MKTKNKKKYNCKRWGGDFQNKI